MKLDFINLKRMMDGKYISAQRHPNLDLTILNYTQKAQFERCWNNETLMCRGLILDGQDRIVARPFKKFFNLSEAINQGEQIPAEDFLVTEKLDGSLGITYFVNGKPRLATRGSFVSEQARRGTLMLEEKYADMKWNPKYTYLMEIIYPSNRIVVDYGDMEDLVLLAIIETKTGKEESYDEVVNFAMSGGMPVVKRYEGITDYNLIEQEPNAEGYVITFLNGQRYKVKFDEYVRLHRLVTGVNARTIWDLLRNDQPFEELLDRVPDEFYEWVKTTKKDLLKRFGDYEHSAKTVYNKIKGMETRKEQAFYIMKNFPKESAIIFQMLDKKPYQGTIWKMLKPAAEKPFKEDIDA